MICPCGYDMLNPAGNRLDRAVCSECSWSASGEGAEHAAYHHHLDTRHPWYLTPFRAE